MTLDPFFAAAWHIQLHALSAIAAVGLGVVQFTAPKGVIPHRVLGYVWVVLMLTVAITAIFIKTGGSFSWIHIFVPITLVGTVHLVLRARRGMTAKHRATALTLFLAGLLVPGAFTFLPGRLMHTVLFG